MAGWGAFSTGTVATISLSTASGVGSGVLLDAQNSIHVVYFASTTARWRHALWTNGTSSGTWADKLVDNAADAAPTVAVALENGTIPHMAFYDVTNGALKHTKYLSGSWTTPTTIESFTAGSTLPYVSLAIGTDLRPRVAYVNGESSSVACGVYNGSSWSTMTVITSTWLGAPSVSVDAAGKARVLVEASSVSVRGLAYGIQQTSSFTVTFAAFTDNSGSAGGASMVLDALDQGFAAFYYGAVDDLYYTKFTSTGGVALNPPTLLAEDVGPFASPTIRFDGNGIPSVVYFSSTSGLGLASYDTDWSTSTLDVGTNVGAAPSLFVSGLDRRFIAYFDGASGALKLATDAPRDLSVSGAVLDFTGSPIAGAALVLAGDIASQSVALDAAGAYAASHLLEGNYTLTPSKAGYTFVPDSLSLAPLQTSLAGRNFSGGPTNFRLVDNLIDPTKGESATLTYSILPGPVTIGIHDLKGRRVRTLLNETRDAGSYSTSWDGRNEDGDVVASGIYLVRFESNPLKEIGKIAVVK
jgi:hypothetical protein